MIRLSPEVLLMNWERRQRGRIKMELEGFSQNLSGGEHQSSIAEMIGGLIEKRGYYSVIDELVATVYNLGEISLADPENSQKMRDFDMWAFAVRAAILKHEGENTFESRVTEADRRFARSMGIILD
jgi:hypothetical protein